MSDPIADAIAKAKAASAAHIENQAASLPATVANTQGAVARAAPLSMADMGGGTLTVDHWLGVKEFGFTIEVGGKKELYAQPIVVTIDLATVQPCFAAKYGANPVTYIKTYDRVTELRGRPWAEALAKAQQIDPRATEYRSVDIPMTAVTDIVLGKGKEPAIKAGESMGYSVPTTGWAPWEQFYRECARKGLSNSVVVTELTFMPKSKNGNNWGLIAFRIMDEKEVAKAA